MRGNVSINDLPNELLIMIFKLLYKLHRQKDTEHHIVLFADDSDDSIASTTDFPFPPPDEHWAGSPFDPSMFPHAQAKVCHRWCALLANSPAYWTRVPITIGSAATSLPTVANYFRWSKDLPIQVFVKRHPHDDSVQDADESSRVAALLPHISQHLHRIKDIEFSLLHQSSIPDLRHWLIGRANILESIHISHKEDRISKSVAPLGEDDTDHRDDGDRTKLKFFAPELTSLTIDAQTFARACKSSKRWLAKAPKLSRLYLTPSGQFSPAESLSLAATITALSHATRLRSLHVRGIHFLEDYATPHSFQPFPEICSEIVAFEDLTGSAVSTFISAAGSLDCVAIKNCSVLGLETFFAGSLYLQDLGEECDLTMLFSDLTTHEIVITNCPAFNDSFLDFMADGGSNAENFAAKATCSLTINNCTNFHVDKLYDMIFARRNAIESNPAWDGTPVEDLPLDVEDLSAIVSLNVWGGPFLPEEYKAKFEQLVPTFHWTNAKDDTNNAI